MSAKQANLYNLAVRMSMSAAGLDKGVAGANKAMDRMDARMRKSSKLFKSFAKGLAAAFSVRAVTQFAKLSIDAADRIDKMSKTVGLSVKTFQELSVAADLSGVSVGLFESSMTAFVKRIGEANNGMGPLTAGLKNMNVELLEALKNAKSQEEAFMILADAVKAAATETEKAAILNAAFGRSGIVMGNMFRDGAKGLDEMREGVKSLGADLTTSTAALKDKWTKAVHNFTVETQKLALQVLPALSKAAETLGKHLETIGKLGAAFIVAFAASKLHAIATATISVSAAASGAAGGLKAMAAAAVLAQAALKKLLPVMLLYAAYEAGGALSKLMNAGKIKQVNLDNLDTQKGITDEYVKQMQYGGALNIDGREGNKIMAERHFEQAKVLKGMMEYRATGEKAAKEAIAAIDEQAAATDRLFQAEEDRMKGVKSFTMDLSKGIGGGGGGGGGGGTAINAAIQSVDDLKLGIMALNEEMNPSIALLNEFRKDAALLKLGFDANVLSLDEYTALMSQLSARFRESGEEASTWGNIISTAVEDFASGMAQTLVDSILSADASFAEFAKNFLAQIAQMIIQAQILAAINAVGGHFNLPGFKSAKSLSVASPGITQFGAASAPRLYDPSASLRTSSASRGEVSVQVNNYADATVKTTSQKDDSGNVKISLMIENVMKDAFGSGRMDRSFAGNYNLRRAPS